MLSRVKSNERSGMSSTRGLSGRRRIGSIVVICAVLVLAGTALAEGALSTGSYTGTTSEHQTVTFRVVNGGRAITNFKSGLAYNGKCGQGGGPDFNVDVSRIAIGTGGKFTKKTTLKLASNHALGEVSGKASGARVTGKIVELLQGKANKCYTETYSASLGQ
jgi:hypothetical protein